MATTTRKRVTRARTASRRRVLPQDRARSARPLDRLLLDGRRLDMVIGDRLTGARLERTIEGASTLTLEVWNDDGAVLRSGALGTRVMSRVARVELDGLGYIIAGVSKSGDTLTFTAEDDVVVTLKRHGKKKPLRISRGRMTRAQFCATMIRQAGVPVLVLDEGVVQAVAGRKQLSRELRKARREVRAEGRDSKTGIGAADLTIKGKRPTKEQRRVMTAALDAAAEEKAGPKATLALLIAIIQESTARNLAGGDRDSEGPLQVRRSTAANLPARTDSMGSGRPSTAPLNPRNVEDVCRVFLRDGYWKYRPFGAIELARRYPDWSAGQIAQACQGSGGSAADYDQWREEGRAWMNASDTQRGDTGATTGAAWVKGYSFERRKDESTWTACRRLLDEVKWRLFVREGVVIIASDTALMRATPALEMTEGSAAVEDIDFDWHRALRIGEMQARAYAGRYQADPGEVVKVAGLPATEARWLLATSSVDLLNPDEPVDLTLRQPQDPAKEPSSEVASSKGETSDERRDGSSTALFDEAKRISDAGGPYTWGGGHGPALSKLSSGQGLDCSSSCSLALYRAGLFGDRTTAIVSGEFASSYGKPGRGKKFTVWANAEHVWIEFHGMDAARFDTSPYGSGGRGPRVRATKRPTTGFTARHYPGL